MTEIAARRAIAAGACMCKCLVAISNVQLSSGSNPERVAASVLLVCEQHVAFRNAKQKGEDALQ